ncbi:MAG: Lrp/AsnC family transcriptional regulator [Haloferacaceae archaeon]
MDEKREVLEILRDDARQTAADIARQTDIDEARVEELIAELEDDGVVRGYRAIVDWERTDDERVTADVELNVELDRETGYADIAGRIAKFPEVTSLRLVSGNYDFALTVEGRSMHAVSQFVSEQVAPIPEVTQTVTHFVMTTYKDGGVEFVGHDEDDRLSVSP